MYRHSSEGAGWSADGAVHLLLLGGLHSGGQTDSLVILLSLLHLMVQQQLEHAFLSYLLLWTCGDHTG